MFRLHEDICMRSLRLDPYVFHHVGAPYKQVLVRSSTGFTINKSMRRLCLMAIRFFVVGTVRRKKRKKNPNLTNLT